MGKVRATLPGPARGEGSGLLAGLLWWPEPLEPEADRACLFVLSGPVPRPLNLAACLRFFISVCRGLVLRW